MDRKVVGKALDNLEQNAGIHAEWTEYVPPKSDSKINAKIKFQINNEIKNYYAEVKKEIRKHHIPHLKEIANSFDPFILIVERLYPNLKEKLREEGINWLDGAGNIHLKNGNYLIWIDRHTTTPADKKKNRAFTKTGLKVVFLFLHDERWVTKTYREIAEKADVALGNITYVFDGLEEKGFLVNETDRKYKLINKRLLLDQWVAAFADELKPRLHVGNFTFLNANGMHTWNDLNLDYRDSWGGEPGAELLTHNLKPAELYLYTVKTKAELMVQYQLKPDLEGKVKVYRSYWNVGTDLDQGTVAPPLVIYTDLMTTGEPRNVKVANEIHEEFLTHLT
ncbi:MAG: type IV toxin-antitoxin system AbiEi family antitoxin [Balneolaceae bacterium]|nr:type IV toxin-antitoxin system AbiEi family antitoxin [Balneolaceae bacterium]